MTMTIEKYCTQLHTGQWFGFKGEKTLDNLILTDYGEEQGYELPTEGEFEDWKEQHQIEQLQKKAEQQARQEALESLIEERIDTAKLEKVKNDIAQGKITEL